MKANKQVNIPGAGITYEKLKEFEGFENLTEEQAKEQIEMINRIARILFNMYLDDEQKENEQ